VQIPDWFTLLVLGAAAWRTFQFVAYDDLLERPRARVLKRLDKEGEYWSLFITCPYCAGFWNALAWWLAWWLISPFWVLALAIPWALSAIVVGLHKVLAMDE
jgi:hypothetical protein